MSDPLQITYQMKDWFIDRAAVVDRVGKLRQKALMVSGAYIQRKAKDLLRSGKKPAKPGTPPKKHSPEPNLRSILFFLDPATDSMVVGPVKFNGKGLVNSNRETIPELMEKGGTALITEYSPDEGQTWMPLDQTHKKQFIGRKLRRRDRQATYAAHPFMSVALEKALPKVPEHLRDLL